MREVEVKAHIRDEAYLLKRLQEHGGVLGDAVTQEDTTETIEKMKKFLGELGVAPEDIGAKRYDVQLLEREYGSI